MKNILKKVVGKFGFIKPFAISLSYHYETSYSLFKIQIMKMSKQTIAETAAKMVIMDAIEKGHTNVSELTEYVKSATFENAVKSYIKIIEQEL